MITNENIQELVKQYLNDKSKYLIIYKKNKLENGMLVMLQI